LLRNNDGRIGEICLVGNSTVIDLVCDYVSIHLKGNVVVKDAILDSNREAKYDSIRNAHCDCGEAFGLYFSERLGKYVCPVCLEKEVIDLQAKIGSLVNVPVRGEN